MLRNILFYIKEAFLSAKKNMVVSLATIISLTAALIIVGIFLIISFNIDNFIADIESQLIAVAYLKDNLSEEVIKKLVQETSELPGVKEVHYISKEDALQKLKEDLKEHEEILAGIPGNPLPSSLEVTVTDTKYLAEIALQLGQYSEIEEVNYGGELTKNLILVFDFVRKTGLAIILVLLFIAILIMFSVIKISVHSRQQEIEIMALVGATSWFIRWPFIIEGFLKGLLSSLMAIFILGRAYLYYVEQAKMIIPFLPISLEQEFIIKIDIILVLLGIFIGVFGSMLSLRKISYEEL
ncbi:MAG: permease-like cell division protein FtsX [Candidatus Caldatribacteriota bacterium]